MSEQIFLDILYIPNIFLVCRKQKMKVSLLKHFFGIVYNKEDIEIRTVTN